MMVSVGNCRASDDHDDDDIYMQTLARHFIGPSDVIKVVEFHQPDDGRTTETCSYVYISNILTYDSEVA
jgi:hypothetical protein